MNLSINENNIIHWDKNGSYEIDENIERPVRLERFTVADNEIIEVDCYLNKSNDEIDEMIQNDNNEPIKIETKTIYSKLDFMLLFTTEERINVRGSIDPVVIDFVELIGYANVIDLSNKQTQDGLKYLYSNDLISDETMNKLNIVI